MQCQGRVEVAMDTERMNGKDYRNKNKRNMAGAVTKYFHLFQVSKSKPLEREITKVRKIKENCR